MDVISAGGVTKSSEACIDVYVYRGRTSIGAQCSVRNLMTFRHMDVQIVCRRHIQCDRHASVILGEVEVTMSTGTTGENALDVALYSVRCTLTPPQCHACTYIYIYKLCYAYLVVAFWL